MAKAPPANVVLLGPRGAGKSVVGRLLADRLGFVFLDTDALVVREAGTSIEAIFAAEGEAGFRGRERRAVSTAAQARGAVIAAGGGVVEDPENVARLAAEGVLILLDARPVVLFKRVAADPAGAASRPPLTGLDPMQEMEVTVRRRRPLYESAAAFTVDTEGKSPEAVAAEVERIVRGLPGGRASP